MRLAAVLCVLLAASPPFEAGVRAFRAGRFQEALDAFRAAEGVAGEDVPAELLHDQALAALQAGAWREALAAAERAALRGGAEYVALRDFVAGNVAYARASRSAVRAALPEGGAADLDEAIAHAARARAAWQAAAMSRADWPAARRNVERALLLQEELLRRREEQEKQRQPPPGEEGAGETPPEVPPEPDAAEPAPPPELEPETLGDLQQERLLERLREVERARDATRAARRNARSADVERDW